MCPFHDVSDNCEILKQREQYFIDWQDHASELSVWTYPICTSQEKVDNALSIFLIAPPYSPEAAASPFLAPCQLP